GHKKEAEKIDPLANLGQDTLQNIVFAALGGHKAEPTTAVKDLPGATPVPESQPVPPPVAPPAEPASSGTAQAITPSKPPVPDTPSPEPAKDLKAQFADMNDAKT